MDETLLIAFRRARAQQQEQEEKKREEAREKRRKRYRENRAKLPSSQFRNINCLPGMPFPKTWAMREKRLRAAKEAARLRAEEEARLRAEEEEARFRAEEKARQRAITEEVACLRAEGKGWWANPKWTTVRLLPLDVTARRLPPAQEAKLHETSYRLKTDPLFEKHVLEERLAARLAAIAERIEQEHREALRMHCAEVVVSWVPDAEYIEAMFQQYSLGRVRLL